MTDSEFLDAWKNDISSLLINLNSVSFALYNETGEMLYASPSMEKFLHRESNGSVKNQIINPGFSGWNTLTNENNPYEGVITLGNYTGLNFSLDGLILKKNANFLLIAGVNAYQLFVQNKQMSNLNQEVNNLQRQLIKEKKKLEQTLSELKNTQDLLVHAEKMNAMGKLVAGVAHELNNPVSFVYSNMFSLESEITEVLDSFREVQEKISDSGNNELQDFIKIIAVKNDLEYLETDITDILKESKNGMERVKTIVEDLRKFSRLDESEIKNTGLLENIQSTLTILRSEIQSKNIDLKLVAPTEIFLDCYPGQLNQAFLNLLINAIQAVPENGKIEMLISEDSENVIVFIKDNGPGIPSEIQGKIFDPFFTTKPVGSGTGLGLSITFKIIHDLHKGTIELAPEPEYGAVFKLIIPKKITT